MVRSGQRGRGKRHVGRDICVTQGIEGRGLWAVDRELVRSRSFIRALQDMFVLCSAT